MEVFNISQIKMQTVTFIIQVNMMKMMNKINAMMAKTSIIMKVLLIILNGLYITNINIQKQMKEFCR